MLGAQHIGAYAVPINWHFAPAEIAYILDDCGARVLVTEQDLLDPLRGLLPADMVVFVVDRAGSETARAWDAALAASEPVVSLPAPPVDSMIYTSGTTGRPKGVRRASAKGGQQARDRKSTRLNSSH